MVLTLTTGSSPEGTERPHRLPYREGRRPMAEDCMRKRLLAIDVLLEDPEEISDGLEAELYALRDKLHLIALGGS